MDDAAGGMREIPYVRSQRFVNDTMRAACGQLSLARLERQGLTLVHFSPQLESFLTLNTSTKHLNTPSNLA
jgi:hypothetical protein